MSKDNKNNSEIKSLKGADRVRKRPSVIFGSDGLEGCKHSFFEILSNSIDEAREGRGNVIDVTYHKDYSITIQDYASGIPVSYNEKEKKYNWELLFTELYAGGKYNNNISGQNYQYSLGTNGLGLCATQYSSEFMQAIICRDGKKYRLEFKKGKNKGGLIEEGSTKSTGTLIKWKPDTDVFSDIIIEKSYFLNLLKEQSIVNSNVKFNFFYELDNSKYEFLYKDGIKDYIKEISNAKEFTPIYNIKDEGYGKDREDKQPYKVKCDIVFTFNNEVNALKYFHNSSLLTHGGSPDSALKTAFIYEIDKFIKKYNKYKKNEKMINFVDIEESLIFISSSFSTVTSYENQTKKSINNLYIKKFLTDTIRKNLEVIFLENEKVTEKIINQILINKRSREKADIARTATKKKLSKKNDLTNKVAKFVDCREKNPKKRELFIVEGDSALGACKLSRDANFQALIPVRGKILNTLKSDYVKIVKNDIIMDLISVIGTGIELGANKKKNPDFDISMLNYDKIIITTDADVDGFQIRTLILTMFYTLVPSLIKEGKVYIVESPLYEIIHNDKSYFAYNDSDKKKILDKIGDEKVVIHRSKGLGENEPKMMWNTTMNPKSRRLIQVDYQDIEESEYYFNSLLGDDIDERKSIIKQKGQDYRELLDLS